MHKFPVFKKVDDCRSYGARDLCTNALLMHIRPKLWHIAHLTPRWICTGGGGHRAIRQTPSPPASDTLCMPALLPNKQLWHFIAELTSSLLPLMLHIQIASDPVCFSCILCVFLPYPDLCRRYPSHQLPTNAAGQSRRMLKGAWHLLGVDKSIMTFTQRPFDGNSSRVFKYGINIQFPTFYLALSVFQDCNIKTLFLYTKAILYNFRSIFHCI